MTREERRAVERADKANEKRERREEKRKNLITEKEFNIMMQSIRKRKLERNSQASNKNIEIIINVKSNAVNLDDLLESTKNLKLNRNVMQSY